jgi:integrase
MASPEKKGGLRHLAWKRLRKTTDATCCKSGLSQATAVNYLPFIDQLLSERFDGGRLNLSQLRAPDVTSFVQRHARDFSPGRGKLLVTALRSFLRHLRHQGKIQTDLAACVPAVAWWSFATMPKFLPASDVQKVLKDCDRQTAIGRRNYAILLLLARLGLRAGEVVSLNLEEIDWDHGHVTVRAKGGRWSQLPLPAEVGEAIAVYLRQDRPRGSCRRVFLRHRAPFVGLANSMAISSLVMRALKSAGVDSERKGAHLFRHGLATEMLRQGASLDEIGDLLRHQSPNTTAIYTKVDLVALRPLALPWPGGARWERRSKPSQIISRYDVAWDSSWKNMGFVYGSSSHFSRREALPASPPNWRRSLQLNIETSDQRNGQFDSVSCAGSPATAAGPIPTLRFPRPACCPIARRARNRTCTPRMRFAGF